MKEWQTEEIQEIADIKPINVIIKDQGEDKPPKIEEKSKDKSISWKGISNIFDYLHLPPPKECNPGILQDLKEIVKLIKPEVKDNDDFFMILQAIDNWAVSDKGNPFNRIDSILNFVKTYKGKIKQTLESQGAITLDVLEEEAKRMGNWKKYLRYVEEQNAKIRSGRRKQ